jgi:DNA-binding PadR family transcriptional regulator
MKFTKEQNKVLSEIYRRLNFFYNGNLEANLLYLALPTDANKIKEFGFIEPYTSPVARSVNWYRLTEKGREFFANYIVEGGLSDEDNLALYNGTYIKEF